MKIRAIHSPAIFDRRFQDNRANRTLDLAWRPEDWLVRRLVIQNLRDPVGLHLRVELRHFMGQYQQIMFAALAVLHLIA